MKRWDYNYLFPIRCYLDSEGKETDKKMRFVDMRIEVDSHIPHWNDKDSEGNWVVDKDREFNLIYSLCLMLASKQCHLQDGREYDEFAYFLAYDVFDKIERPRHPETPIKSVLNYIKSIIVWRKMRFQAQTFQQVFDSKFQKNWNNDAFKLNVLNNLQSSNKLKTAEEVKTYIKEFPGVIFENIPVQFKDDTYVMKNIYVSVCLSLIKAIEASSSRRSHSLKYNQNISLFGLDDSYKSVVRLVVNKSLLNFGENVKSTIEKFKIDDDEFELILNSAYDGLLLKDDE